MRKTLKTSGGIYPMPVIMIATYNEDGTVDVMNAAWGTMLEMNQVILNLTPSHKTVKNIKERKAFTIGVGTVETVTECDYLGIVSGNDTPDKFEKSGLAASKAEKVDAPVINEFPICLECEYVEGESDWGIVGKIVNVTADESVMEGDNIDMGKINAIAYDPFTHGYYKISERVGDAFKQGAKLK